MSLQPTNSPPIILQGLQTFLEIGGAFGKRTAGGVVWVRTRSGWCVRAKSGKGDPLGRRHVEGVPWRKGVMHTANEAKATKRLQSPDLEMGMQTETLTGFTAASGPL